MDARNLTDYLSFAKRYAPYIKFYQTNNTAFGTWEPFWNKDVSAVIAGLADLPVESLYRFQIDLRNFLINIPDRLPVAAQAAALQRHFRLHFHLPILLVQQVTHTLYQLPLDHPLREKLSVLLEREGKGPFAQIVAYYHGALAIVPDFVDEPLSDKDFADPAHNISLPALIRESLQKSRSFSTYRLQLPYTNLNWGEYYLSVNADQRPFQEENIAYRQIFDALNYQAFTAAFDRVMELMSHAHQEAKKYLTASLEDYQAHTPHYGLWLTFQRLLKYNRQELNAYTRRHLEFYYERILGLHPLAPQPDQVHVWFELNKDQSDTLLPTGTLLQAGKDAENKPVHYRLSHDLVVNHAKVALLHSVYAPSASHPIAALRPDTSDGVEEELEGDFPSWPAFFPGLTGGPKARLGFAIADELLLLAEGRRTIRLKFNLNVPDGFARSWRIFYTGEEGWEPVTDVELPATQPKQILLRVSIDQPPVVAYDPKVHFDAEEHGDAFQAGLPMLKFELINDYGTWSGFSFSSIDLRVIGHQQESLSIEHQAGAADTSKAFPLFGAQPGKQPYFLLRYPEAFRKPLTKLVLVPEWEDEYTSSKFYKKKTKSDYTPTIELKRANEWEALHLNDESKTTLLSVTDNTVLNFTNTERGLQSLRFTLPQSFGHQEYSRTFALAMMEKAKTNGSYSNTNVNLDSDSIPKSPYPAILKSLYLTYQTAWQAPTQFYSLYPFGFKQETNPGRLSPGYGNRGEFYLGISGLKPPQRLSLLVQVADGTAAPLAEPAEMQWAYLQDDEWQTSGLEVDDKTDQFTRSGLLSFTVPKAANTKHHLLPADYHWFRCNVAQHTDALNNLRGIHAQAAKAIFVDQENDPQFLASPLPAKTIGKLVTPVAAIKSVHQPYPSFGGHGPEAAAPYYTRVSERLRHKNRAVQIWDYEHLILQHFPDIYKVKCLNHTQLENAGRPGCVTVVCLPQVHPNSKDPLRPYVEKKRLLDICRFLKARISPFVQLKVIQPRLEEVQLEFSVAFTPDIADIPFYRAKLNEALIRYLSPWAFTEGVDISFGGQWHKSRIIQMVDELPYVDYITDVKMFHKPDISVRDGRWQKLDVEVVNAATDRSVLVSHSDHIIHNIGGSDTGGSTEDKSCISEQITQRPC